MTSLLDFLKPESPDAPHLHHLVPPAAMPGGEIEVHGSHLGPLHADLPSATIGDTPAPVALSRPTRATIRIPEGSISGDLVLHRNGASSNALYARVAVPMAENLHPVANPAVDADGRLFATFSGSRNQQVPVSIFSIDRDFQIRPFVRDLLNPSGLAFGPDGLLYASSRAEGTIYRISPEGKATLYAEGLGVATGIAFDAEGNLYVGDRSGTIFKIAAKSDPLEPEDAPRSIFVFATLEPSMAAYHLAFNGTGTLFVTGPTTSSNQLIHAIAPDGTTSMFYQGLGRAQGMAFDVDDNLYVAASLHGQRGIVRITPRKEASLAVSGSNLVGLAFLEDGCAALATRDALYHVALDIEGRRLA
ncbi:gluconolaconase [Granulicella aggregans]|uniref:gluconolaconase n=1 Tax=Granulicella aggregans TaxID=474949 RepID=UPI0021DFB79A|nr:gluconolaconase [Granulicella aggregans]